MKEIVYKKFRISCNSIVPKGAMRKKAIFKSEDGKECFEQRSKIYKNDDAMEMTSIMFLFNKADSQGHIIKDIEVMKEARDDFMLNSNKQITFNHKDQIIKAQTVELWIVKKEDKQFPDDPGAIVTITRFFDREKWDLVKNENWETSIEGYLLDYEEVEKESVINKAKKAIKEHFKPIEAQNMELTKEDIASIVATTVTAELEKAGVVKTAAQLAKEESDKKDLIIEKMGKRIDKLEKDGISGSAAEGEEGEAIEKSYEYDEDGSFEA